MEQESEKTATAVGRKRKSSVGESESFAVSVQAKTPRIVATAEEKEENSASSEDSSCESGDPDDALSSCCSSNLAKECSDFVDLENVEGTDKLFSVSAIDTLDSGDRRETMPSHETVSESNKLKMPTAQELEEFFAAAETQLQKQFFDKYNYDIENDLPRQGRFEWVQLQPQCLDNQRSQIHH